MRLLAKLNRSIGIKIFYVFNKEYKYYLYIKKLNLCRIDNLNKSK
jgi:phenolic acid decarboxylase